MWLDVFVVSSNPYSISICMPKVEWYSPTDRGLEGKIREKLDYLRALDAEKRGNS